MYAIRSYYDERNLSALRPKQRQVTAECPQRHLLLPRRRAAARREFVDEDAVKDGDQ